eukprot:jgi/Psemu1/23175/gm1.23175_g
MGDYSFDLEFVGVDVNVKTNDDFDFLRAQEDDPEGTHWISLEQIDELNGAREVGECPRASNWKEDPADDEFQDLDVTIDKARRSLWKQTKTEFGIIRDAWGELHPSFDKLADSIFVPNSKIFHLIQEELDDITIKQFCRLLATFFTAAMIEKHGAGQQGDTLWTLVEDCFNTMIVKMFLSKSGHNELCIALDDDKHHFNYSNNSNTDGADKYEEMLKKRLGSRTGNTMKDASIRRSTWTFEDLDEGDKNALYQMPDWNNSAKVCVTAYNSGTGTAVSLAMAVHHYSLFNLNTPFPKDCKHYFDIPQMQDSRNRRAFPTVEGSIDYIGLILDLPIYPLITVQGDTCWYIMRQCALASSTVDPMITARAMEITLSNRVRETYEVVLSAVGRAPLLPDEAVSAGNKFADNESAGNKSGSNKFAGKDSAGNADEFNAAADWVQKVNEGGVAEFLQALKTMNEDTTRNIVARHEHSNAAATLVTICKKLEGWVDCLSTAHQKYHWYCKSHLIDCSKVLDPRVKSSNTQKGKPHVLDHVVEAKAWQQERVAAIDNSEDPFASSTSKVNPALLLLGFMAWFMKKLSKTANQYSGDPVYVELDAESDEFNRWIPNHKESFQLLHHVAVRNLQKGLIIIGDTGKIMFGVFVNYKDETIAVFWKVLEDIFDQTLKPFYASSIDEMDLPLEKIEQIIQSKELKLIGLSVHSFQTAYFIWRKLHIDKHLLLPLPPCNHILPYNHSHWNNHQKGVSDTCLIKQANSAAAASTVLQADALPPRLPARPALIPLSTPPQTQRDNPSKAFAETRRNRSTITGGTSGKRRPEFPKNKTAEWEANQPASHFAEDDSTFDLMARERSATSGELSFLFIVLGVFSLRLHLRWQALAMLLTAAITSIMPRIDCLFYLHHRAQLTIVTDDQDWSEFLVAFGMKMVLLCMMWFHSKYVDLILCPDVQDIIAAMSSTAIQAVPDSKGSISTIIKFIVAIGTVQDESPTITVNDQVNLSEILLDSDDSTESPVPKYSYYKKEELTKKKKSRESGTDDNDNKDDDTDAAKQFCSRLTLDDGTVIQVYWGCPRCYP